MKRAFFLSFLISALTLGAVIACSTVRADELHVTTPTGTTTFIGDVIGVVPPVGATDARLIFTATSASVAKAPRIVFDESPGGFLIPWTIELNLPDPQPFQLLHCHASVPIFVQGSGFAFDVYACELVP